MYEENNFYPKKEIWITKYDICTYDLDAGNKTSFTCIGKLLQEVAFNHADHLDVGLYQLNKKNHIWVLSKLLINVKRYPLLCESIEIQTWPVGIDRLFALRDFQIIDSNREIIASAIAAFLVIDIKTRRPQRLDFLEEMRLSIPEKCSMNVGFSDIPRIVNSENGNSFIVKYSDLDLYNHVNNVKYFEWIIDNYSFEFLNSRKIKNFEINYLLELGANDEVILNTKKMNDFLYVHNIVRKVDLKEICRARVEWIEV